MSRLATREQQAVRGVDLRVDEPASVEAHGVFHVFDNGFRALEPTDLTVEAGTFCTLLGPSGSGKTTLLRIFAGLLEPSGGTVRIGSEDVTNLSVQKRDIGFVFQHYALFPHMTVAENIAYPLKIRDISKSKREAKVRATLELIDLAGYGDRRPDQLSGGQQQRVAIGRALVYQPKLLLLDEPLGALDRKLRQQLGADLRRIQQETGTTAVYVTHDQEEAFLLSDTIVVMDHGTVKQIGSPDDVYARPTDLFVAGFLGDTNVLRGTVESERADGATVNLHGLSAGCRSGIPLTIGDEVSCTIRPEDIRVTHSTTPEGYFVLGEGTVVERVFMGSRTHLMIEVGAIRLTAEAGHEELAPAPGTAVSVYWRDNAPVVVSD